MTKFYSLLVWLPAAFIAGLLVGPVIPSVF